jgi:hypothetical protein
VRSAPAVADIPGDFVHGPIPRLRGSAARRVLPLRFRG